MTPIILVPGIARFDILRQQLDSKLKTPPKPLDNRLEYFKGIGTHLNDNGFSIVKTANVGFGGSITSRAQELKFNVESILSAYNAEKVNIIAHSVGGLAARYMIVELGMADKVESLTTIGTPHHGSIVADQILKNPGKLWVRFLREAIDFNLEIISDLTVRACSEFNLQAEGAEAKNDVMYQTYSSFDTGQEIFSPLLASWFLVQQYEGNNDGLVSVSSQKWTNELVAVDGTRKMVLQNELPIRADHLNQCGWSDLSEAVITVDEESLAKNNNYEAQIRDVYLSIASSLPGDSNKPKDPKR
jgi:triacylglycerol lipase